MLRTFSGSVSCALAGTLAVPSASAIAPAATTSVAMIFDVILLPPGSLVWSWSFVVSPVLSLRRPVAAPSLHPGDADGHQDGDHHEHRRHHVDVGLHAVAHQREDQQGQRGGPRP